jgi:hypothetical protein
VLRNEHRRGYADSLEMLLREAVRRSEYPRRDIIVVLQADFTEDPEHLTTLIRRIESGADLVVSNAGWGERPPPRAFRWGRALLKRMLRRFSWPEGAGDPLTGLNAYRVVCVKRAMEEREGGRLLRFDGWAANAELLREAAPHARRVDAVDLTVRRERLQRPERFQFRPVFNEVLAFIRNRPTAKRTVEQLAPDGVMGGRSQHRTLSAESLRETTVSNGARSAGPSRKGPQRPRPQRGEREERAGRRDRSGTERGRSRTASGGAREERKRAPASDAQPQRKSRSRKSAVPPAPSIEGAVNDTDAPAAAETGEAPARKRKTRKRSRRGGANGQPKAGPGTAAEGTSLTAEETVPQPVMNGAEVPFVLEGEGGGDEESAGAPKKRRRGSRGGRRRNRGAGKGAPEATTDETTSGPEVPPDAAAAG